jgi:hypothetical protein
MASGPYTLASNVATLLNGSLTAGATLAFAPSLDIGDTTNRVVLVVPRSVEEDMQTRSGVAMQTMAVDVGVLKKTGTSTSAIEAELVFCEAIASAIRQWHPTNGTAIVGVKVDPLYIQKHLSELGQFTSILTVSALRAVQ